MLKRWLIAQRRKPKAARDRMALIVAVSVTSLILLVWLATLPFRYQTTPVPEVDVFGSFSDTVSSEIDSVRERLPKPATTTPTMQPAPVTIPSSTAATTSSTSVMNTPSQGRTVMIATTTASSSTSAVTP